VAALDLPGAEVAALGEHLDDDERRRAARFHFERDRVRFAGGRAMLRVFLADRLGLPPRQIRFVYGRHGKPALAPEQASSGVRFNVSHSHGMGLFVFARRRAIGADIERIRPLRHGDAVARRFFARDEVEALSALSGAEWERAFFRCWTRKEAFIKALGDGLSYPLRGFTVSVREGDPARLLRVELDPAATARYWLSAIPAGQGYEAAIACEGRPCPIVRIAAPA
jgi:4'-phosphopantetheinyl transferase